MVKPYSVRVENQGDTTTIVLCGEIDLAAGPALRAAVAQVILGEPKARLVFDLTDTTFVDSTAMSALVIACHGASLIGASVRVTSNPLVDRVLEASGVSDLFASAAELAPTG